ncbi:MAG: polar amino acid ABC transporter permease, partial [Caulobacter sp. 39-67-4]
MGIVGALLLIGGGAFAQGGAPRLSALEVIWKWFPLLMSGFGFNILMSVLAMALG